MPDVAIVSPDRDKVFSRMLSLELELKKSISSVCTDYSDLQYDGLRLIIVSSGDAAAMSSVLEKATAKQIPCLTFGTKADKKAAPDFIRPFAVDVFLERVYSILFRDSDASDAATEQRNYILDNSTNTVMCGNKTVLLSPREFQLFTYLYRNRGRVISREELREKVWETDAVSNNTDVYINYLRRKFEEKFNKRLIHTVRGEGYQFKN